MKLVKVFALFLLMLNSVLYAVMGFSPVVYLSWFALMVATACLPTD